MRRVWLVLGIATAHRLLTTGIACLGFLIGMASFNGGSGKPIFSLFQIAAIMDLPVVLLDRHSKGDSNSLKESGAHNLAILRKGIWPWQMAWSLSVGGIVAFVVPRYRNRKGDTEASQKKS